MAGGSVAVVIPTKNGAPFIAETLESVRRQTRRPDEVVVVDDGSSDGTVDIVATFDGVRLLQNAGTGANAARATGIAANECEFIALLDHDDIWFPHHLETLLRLLDRVPEAVMAYSSARHFRSTPAIEPPSHQWPWLIDLWKIFPRTHAWEPCSTVFRRAALDEIGGWPTWQRVPSDTYMWFRLADVGPLVHWPGGTAGYRRHAASVSRSALRDQPVAYLRGRFALLEDALGHHLERHPHDEVELRGRLDLLRDLCDLVAAIEAGDVEEMRQLVGRVRGGDVESSDLSNVRAALSGAINAGPDGWRNALRSHRAWPDDAVDLRRFLLDPCLADAAVAAVRRDPSQPGRWGIPVSRDVLRLARPLAVRAVSAVARRANAWTDADASALP